MAVWIALAVVALCVFIALRGYFAMLGGEDLRQYDMAVTPDFTPASDSPGLQRVNAFLDENFIKPAQAAGAKRGWTDKRERFDQAGLARTDLDAEYRDDIAIIDGIKVPGQWTLVSGADPKKRLLYLHGGAFTVGSAISHRPLTVNLAKRTGAAVFAPNYRLMPENHRLDGIKDCQITYQWILENGPDGPAPLTSFAIAGDSAGGNLAAHMMNWARDNGHKTVNAAFILSPVMDGTLSTPSIRRNLDKDLMLKPMLSPLAKLPKPLLLLASKKHFGLMPTDPRNSPLHSDLSDLPPTLVQASFDEMMFDDSVRYTRKAQQAGSPVTLQSWSNMPHVFQIFDDVLPEAHHALDEAADFLGQHGF